MSYYDAAREVDFWAFEIARIRREGKMHDEDGNYSREYLAARASLEAARRDKHHAALALLAV
jgi:hypothetical protein